MDALYRERLASYCLVSSDSDFTRLAQRLREAVLHFTVSGERKTPQAFRSAWHRFVVLGKASNGMAAVRDGRPKGADR